MVELETVCIHTTPSLDDAYRLSAALYEVGIPSYIANDEGLDLPAADEGRADAATAGPGPYRVSVYPAEQDMAREIIAETFGG